MTTRSHLHTRLLALAAATAILAGCGTARGPAGVASARAALSDEARAAAAAAIGEGLPPLSEELGPEARAIAPLAAPARPTRRAPGWTEGNQAVLYSNTPETFAAAKAFISGAKRSLWIEMFEFGGSYGKVLVPLLIERARAGVQVKLLVDQAGSGGKTKGIVPWVGQLAAAGVEVRFYPARLRHDGSKWRFNITHRKLLLADGELGMAGGTNFGTHFETTTHDIMVGWRGPVVADLYKEFATEWKFVGGGDLPLPQGPMPRVGDVAAQVAVTSVPEGRFEIRDAVFKAIDEARSEIVIEQQYLWEDALEKHLIAALGRGVRVRAMVPGGTKEKYTLSTLNMEALKRLVAAGAEARVYYDEAAPESHLHIKYFGVDDRWCATGSANGDARSFVDHQELDVLSTSPHFARHVRERMFERDWARYSKPWVYKPAKWYERPFRNLLELVDYLF